MATLSDLREYVRSQSLVEADDLSAARTTALLNRGYLELSASADWAWLRSYETLGPFGASPSGSQQFSLSNDFGRLRKVSWVVDPSVDASTPEYRGRLDFNIFPVGPGWQLRLTAPLTDTYVQALVEYLRVPAEMTGDGESPNFYPQFHYILAEFALWKMMEREEMYDRAAVHRNEYWTLFAGMRAHDNRVITEATPWQVGERRRDGATPWR
jgi:hypothetical protein